MLKVTAGIGIGTRYRSVSKQSKSIGKLWYWSHPVCLYLHMFISLKQ